MLRQARPAVATETKLGLPSPTEEAFGRLTGSTAH